MRYEVILPGYGGNIIGFFEADTPGKAKAMFYREYWTEMDKCDFVDLRVCKAIKQDPPTDEGVSP